MKMKLFCVQNLFCQLFTPTVSSQQMAGVLKIILCSRLLWGGGSSEMSFKQKEHQHKQHQHQHMRDVLSILNVKDKMRQNVNFFLLLSSSIMKAYLGIRNRYAIKVFNVFHFSNLFHNQPNNVLFYDQPIVVNHFQHILISNLISNFNLHF